MGAISSSSCSEWCGPITCSPTGRPSTEPAGIDTAGLPARFAGIVRAPLLPSARSKPTWETRSAPSISSASGPAAGKATSGLVEQKTKSASSNRSAIASLCWMRNVSFSPASRRL